MTVFTTSAPAQAVRAIVLLCAIVGISGSASAQSSPPPAYSARAVHQLPDGTMSSGIVIKSGPDMRLEYTENGRQMVQIIRRAAGTMYLLDPAAQTYIEVQGAPSPDPNGAGYMPPCQDGDPSMVCTFTGTEVTSGIKAEIWEIALPGQPGVTTILWDGARHKALRQLFPDGSNMQMTFREMADMAGRTVEHWSVAYETPGQQPMAGDWFYDPELRVEVRDVMPSGESRTLEDIQVGPVDAALFEVPAGWTRLDMPAAPMAPAPSSGN